MILLFYFDTSKRYKHVDVVCMLSISNTIRLIMVRNVNFDADPRGSFGRPSDFGKLKK